MGPVPVGCVADARGAADIAPLSGRVPCLCARLRAVAAVPDAAAAAALMSCSAVPIAASLAAAALMSRSAVPIAAPIAVAAVMPRLAAPIAAPTATRIGLRDGAAAPSRAGVGKREWHVARTAQVIDERRAVCRVVIVAPHQLRSGMANIPSVCRGQGACTAHNTQRGMALGDVTHQRCDGTCNLRRQQGHTHRSHT
eukprot:360154-Chlamydomonas_euryale.AAC.9